MMSPTPTISKTQRRIAQAVLMAFSFHMQAWASDIANLPLATQPTGAARANLMLIFDNSGSMGWDYLPDNANFNRSKYGFYASQCNGLHYNPSVTYRVPVDANGSPLASGTFTVPSLTSVLTSQAQITSPSPSIALGITSALTISGGTGAYAVGQMVTLFNSTTPTNQMIGTVKTLTGSTLTVNVMATRGTGSVNTVGAGWPPYYFIYSGAEPKLGYKYTASGNVITNTFYNECNSTVGSTPGSAVFTPVVVSATMSDFQNYANWYTYYQTRVQMARTSIGLVMADLDASRFRVGWNTISTDQGGSSVFNTTYTKTTNIFLPVSEFDQGTQKQDFYSYLYGVGTGSSTPLRPALEKIGKYYAGRQMNGTPLAAITSPETASSADPVQYSCQRNFTVLLTDGYWNTGSEPNSYTPTRLNGSTPIGNTDGPGSTNFDGSAVARPRLDEGRTSGSNWIMGGSGVSNSLADIAQYFFVTDLRQSGVANTRCIGSIANQDVCTDNVAYETPPPNLPAEQVRNQRMTTYTVGLGLGGLLQYQSDYDTANSGDYFSIKNGSLPWSNANTTSNSSSVVARVDDLWHAAVNGRGRYYSAGNPADLVTSLSDALSNIASATGTSSAAATSSQLPVSGDNFAFLGQYTSGLWEGNVKAFTIDTSNGAISTAALWEAKNTLKAQVSSGSDSRRIVFRDTSVTGTNLSEFTYGNLSARSLGANFDISSSCAAGSTTKLTQCPSLVASLGSAAVATSVTGDSLVNFLRGRTANEDTVANPVSTRLYRSRPNTPLGDVVNASPVYVKKPVLRYADAGYNTFQTAQDSRTAVLYVAANDGMLHALRASDGVELWAYVPTAVMPNMYRLADARYDNNHRFFVDASPVVGDVKDSSGNWRTILVGGLGAGGRSYYALDVTDPANPKSLWEFSVTDDNDLGYTFGNPVITKNKAGTWVVVFSSGYNNINPGSGNGALFIRDAVTGAALASPKVSKIPTLTSGTPVGDTTTPNELGKINPWIDVETNNTATRFYGGDMLGNLWRFDFDDNIAPSGYESTLLGQARTSGGAIQPISTKPITFKVGGDATLPAVAFATGRYLGASDIGDATRQSLYVIKETLSSTGLGVLRNTAANLQAQSMNASHVVTASSVDWTTQNGWYVDFPAATTGQSSERVNVDMQQTGKLLVVAANQPAPSACNAGGNSVLFSIDITSGALTDTAQTFTTLTAGLNLIKIGGVLKIIRWDTSGNPTVTTPTLPGGSAAATRRTSWREIVN